MLSVSQVASVYKSKFLLAIYSDKAPTYRTDISCRDKQIRINGTLNFAKQYGTIVMKALKETDQI